MRAGLCKEDRGGVRVSAGDSPGGTVVDVHLGGVRGSRTELVAVASGQSWPVLEN